MPMSKQFISSVHSLEQRFSESWLQNSSTLLKLKDPKSLCLRRLYLSTHTRPEIKAESESPTILRMPAEQDILTHHVASGSHSWEHDSDGQMIPQHCYENSFDITVSLRKSREPPRSPDLTLRTAVLQKLTNIAQNKNVHSSIARNSPQQETRPRPHRE